jgi:hypothetical protein
VSVSAEFLRLFTIQQLSNGSVAQFSDRAEVSPVVCLDLYNYVVQREAEYAR